MNRRITGVVGAAAALGLSVMAVPGVAHAAPAADDSPSTTSATTKSDNRLDRMAQKRTALRQRAVEQLVSGKARTVGRGPDRTIRMSDGTQVDYPVSQSAQLLTFLVQFGDGAGNPAFVDNTAGPSHNEIPEPARSDNSTYWRPNFDRQHYMDMFFTGLADQNGESFKSVYKEMSSGRFDLEGDVSDWVTVPHPASYYQDATGNETGAAMTNYIQDSSTSWYDAQVAAGKSDQEIKDYLKTFDVWDRYDYDHDGDFNESDGYIDHFQAIHAGEGEEAGAPAWAIWSHRWSVQPYAAVGPEGNKSGGIQIGNTGYWIRDYTTEPENGGLGVFAHEFGHDLGLPDYYDTQGGDNSTGYWNLMSSGSWLGHGVDAIGTTPGHMGATEKLFLGWYGTDDLVTVDGTGSPRQVVLGPSNHATTTGAQALAVSLPQGSSTVDVVQPDQGQKYFYSGNGDDRTATATGPSVTVPGTDPTLTARVSYSLEDDYDYSFLKVSTDGGTTWDYVTTNLSSATDPNGTNKGGGITGCSGVRDVTSGVCDNAWTDLTADLSAYAGQEVKLQFETDNDAGYHELGFSVDSIALGGSLVTDVEDGAPAWTLDKYQVITGSSYTKHFEQYYLAENRSFKGYDTTLGQGPYSFDYPVSAPNKVDHYGYQDGLLVWYWNGLYADNNTNSSVGHPGGGSALPVDANPAYVRWKKAGANIASGSGRLNTSDSTFDVDDMSPLHLASEANGGQTFDLAGGKSVPVFDDSNTDTYWDGSSLRASWYSTKVAGIGAMIQVLSSDDASGRMVVKAGRRFVAPTSTAQIQGSPVVGQTLTAVAPTYFQTDATPSYQWTVAGTPVAGATGATYVVKGSDAGKKVGVVVTGAKEGYLPATDTAEVSATTAGAPVATTAPSVSGTPRVGQTLTVTPGTWPVAGTSTYAWSVGGTAAGTGTSYTLKPADSGKTVTVTETRTAQGYQPGTATSAPTEKVLPAPVAMKVSAPAKAKKGKAVTLKVSVSSSSTPGGSIQVTWGGKTLAAKSLSGGQVTFHLPAQKRAGNAKAVVTYVPSTGYEAASKTVTVKITK